MSIIKRTCALGVCLAAMYFGVGCGGPGDEPDTQLAVRSPAFAAIGLAAAHDCNGNGIADEEELAAGSATDCNENGIIDACEPTDVSVDQWASEVLGFSSQFAPTGWSANQILGEPDVFVYADQPEAWAPMPRNGTLEYITVGFEQPVYATAVTIRETYGNGMVFLVELLDLDGELHLAWEGDDPSEPGLPVNFRIDLPTSAMLVQGVKVHIDTDTNLSTWEELDAIRLTGLLPGLTDCNSNGLADVCELDADGNGIPDDCEETPGDVVDCNGNGIDDSLDLAASTSEDCDSDGIPDECGSDMDGDGWVDACDVCPDSDLSRTIVIGQCDTGVANGPGGDDGCTMADDLAVCRESARNHGQFVTCVVKLSMQWVRQGLIRQQDKARIVRCAARDRLPIKRPIERITEKPGRAIVDKLR